LPPDAIRLEAPLPDQPDTMTSVREHFEAGTLERGLTALETPALFIHGEGDPMPMKATTESAALIPGAKVKVIAHAGHFPWLEQPGVVRRLVKDFLASLEVPADS
jgi:pimeloyl-ACP methyl ester carboxylesterase